MKFFHIRLLIVFAALGAVLPASGMNLEEAGDRFETELNKILAEETRKQNELKPSYLAAIERVELRAREEADLDGLQACRMESRTVEEEEGLSLRDLSDYEALRVIQEIVNRQLRRFAEEAGEDIDRLVDSVSRFAREQSRELTRNNEIDKALAWNEWRNSLPEHPEVARIAQLRGTAQPEQERQRSAGGDSTLDYVFSRTPAPWASEAAAEFPFEPRGYVAGSEPEGNEVRLSGISTPNARAVGNQVMTGRVKLIEEEETLRDDRSGNSHFRQRRYFFVPRLEYAPLPDQELPKLLAVFDLYVRGTGSRRELIRTDQILLPPVARGNRVVVDAAPYSYETSQRRVRGATQFSDSTGDEFYGFVISLFDESGELIFQRASERMLNSLAREEAPDLHP